MSLRAFFLNWMGAKVPEDQMLHIEHSRFEVQWYNTMKCMEIGAVLGCAYAMRAPVMRYLGRPIVTTPAMSRMDYSRSMLRASRSGMIGGLVASVPMAMVYTYRQRLNNDASYYMKAVELRHSKRQLNLDRGAMVAGLGSGVFYKAMFGLPLSLGFAQGMALGTMGVAIFNTFDWLYHRNDKLTDNKTLDKLSGKVQEQVDSAKGSLRNVSHQAQERAEDAKGSLKKAAEDTKDKFKKVSEDTKDKFKKVSEDTKGTLKKVSEEGKDSLKKASNKAQDYAQEFKSGANELKNKAKETVQNEYKKMEHRAD